MSLIRHERANRLCWLFVEQHAPRNDNHDHARDRLVRAEVDLNEGCIRFYALRRREPDYQPLLKMTPYSIPQKKRFRE